MSKLYWRIFLAFWAVIILTTVVTSLVNALCFADEVEFTRAQMIRASRDALGEPAAARTAFAQAVRAGGLDDGVLRYVRQRITEIEANSP